MDSHTTKAFRAALAALPAEARLDAQAAYALFQENPRHPGLHLKQIHRRKRTFYSVRIGIHYRALGLIRPDGVYWFWIGPHAEYDALIDRL